MKAKKSNSSATRHYHISLLVFLIALGLAPVSLMSGGASANAEKPSEQNAGNNTEKSSILNKDISGTTKIFSADDDLLWGDPFKKPAVDETSAEVAQTEEISAAEEVQPDENTNSEVSEEPAYEPQVAYETPVVYEIPVAYETPVAYEAPVVYEPPVVYDQISIAGNNIPIFYSDNTLIDAGSQVGLYGNHFLYGHNTANVFGGLSGMNIGDYFTITLGGQTRTYQVINRDLQTKSHFEGDVIRKTVVSGVTVLTKMKMMKAITAYGEYNGGHYDYILMTCAGTSYGNGDASHRLILMANEV